MVTKTEGRAKKPEQARERFVQVRLTDEEYEKVEKLRWKLKEATLSGVMRRCMVDTPLSKRSTS